MSLGGAEKQQINILNGMDSQKFEIKLYILKNKTQLLPQMKNNHVTVEIYDINSASDIKELLRFLKSIRSFKPDIIHSHMYIVNILTRFLKVLSPKSKIVNHIHGMTEWITKPKLFLDKVTSPLVDRFIVVSEKSFELRSNRERYPQEKMVLLYNSVDLKAACEKKQKKSNRVLTIGMASRLIPLKNIEGALYLFSELIKKGIDLQIKIAGDGPEKNKLVAYSQGLGIGERTNFVGYIENMGEFYSQIDIYCISSKIEDLPLSVIEAMMSGKPIIASNVGGIPDVLGNVSCTKLVNDFSDKNEIEDIYKFITKLDSDVCSKTLIKHASSTFDNHAYCKKLEKIYDSLVSL